MKLFDAILALLRWTMAMRYCTVTGLPLPTNYNGLIRPKMIAQGEGSKPRHLLVLRKRPC